MRRSLLVVPLLVLAGAVPTGTAPAQAAACSGGGVTVVVDYHQLGSGVDQRCDAGGGGKTADQIFGEAGFTLTYVQRQPGFVCRINGSPSGDTCVSTPPSDAYWGLFSASAGGGWTYASTGVGGLEVPDGGSVAFSWQGSSAQTPPGVSPARASAASAKPVPAKKPTRRPTAKASAKPSSLPAAAPTGSAAAPAPSAVATASVAPTPSPSAAPPTSTPPTPSVVATPSATDTASGQALEPTSARPGDSEDQGGLPWWVPVGVIVLLAGGGAGVVLMRRRQATS